VPASPLDDVVFRPLAPGDDVAELTALLHRAYARLAAMGFNYTATSQDDDVTRRRCASGECWVGVRAGRVVATLTLVPPGGSQECATFARPGVAVLQQFAVEPSLQGRGVGGALFRRLEERAREIGAEQTAGDTAEGAHHLVAWYLRMGYAVVERVQWPGKTYQSVVVLKRLAR
jgi:GNAT superfamily N-acetyltransferase